MIGRASAEVMTRAGLTGPVRDEGSREGMSGPVGHDDVRKSGHSASLRVPKLVTESVMKRIGHVFSIFEGTPESRPY